MLAPLSNSIFNSFYMRAFWDQFKNWISVMKDSLKIVDVPHNFWKPCREDIFPCLSMFSISVLTWLLCGIIYEWNAPLCYWDGPNYAYAAKTMYKITEDNPWTKYFKYPPYYFACHLPGYPIVIRLLSIPFFNNIWIGNTLSIFLIPIILAYAFRRMLVIYKSVADPIWTTALLSILPIRFWIYHSVGASEPLFMTCACLSFIFFKTGDTFLMCMAICWGCLTRVEGLILIGTFGLCSLLRLDIKRAFCVGLTILVYVGIILFHKKMFGYYDAYIKFNQGNQQIIEKYPLKSTIRAIRYGGNSEYMHSFFGHFFLFFLGVGLLYSDHLPYAIYASAYFVYASMLNHLDIYRYSVPGYTMAILIGFDPFLSTPHVKKSVKYMLPFYLIIGITYSTGQINSNKAPMFFVREALG